MGRIETGRHTSLPRTSPEALGIPSSAVEQFLDAIAAEGLELHSIMLLRHGQVAAEGWWAPYAAENKNLIFSLSKSFTSTAVGIAAGEGLLSLDDKVVDWFPEDVPEDVSPNLAAMNIRHLLMMGTGHTEDTTEKLFMDPEGNWPRMFLSLPVEREPGTHFVYNSGASYMLSAILRKATGVPLLDYLKDRLFAPLGIPDATWETCPRGIAVGGWGLSIRTEDIAKFGQLYLQDGVWEGRRILPEGWAAEASAKQIANGDDPNSDWNQGYGYQFWLSRHGYRADGAFGQFCIVLPEQQAVVAITSAVNNMGSVMHAVWTHLLPAMQGAEPLPANPSAHEALAARLLGLKLDPPADPIPAELERLLHGREFVLEDNPIGFRSVRIDFAEDEASLTLAYAGCSDTIRLGRGRWLAGRAAMPGGPAGPQTLVVQQVECAVTSHGDGALSMIIRPIETPFAFITTIRPDGENGILLDLTANVSIFPAAAPPIRGRAASVSA